MTTTHRMAAFHQLRRTCSAMFFRSQQEFDIAFRPGDRARDDPKHGPPMAFNPVPGRCTDALVHGGIADDTALPDFLAPGFELRLDQRDEPAAAARKL